MIDCGEFFLHLAQLLVNILSLLARVARVQVLTLHDVDARLHRILIERID